MLADRPWANHPHLMHLSSCIIKLGNGHWFWSLFLRLLRGEEGKEKCRRGVSFLIPLPVPQFPHMYHDDLSCGTFRTTRGPGSGQSRVECVPLSVEAPRSRLRGWLCPGLWEALPLPCWDSSASLGTGLCLSVSPGQDIGRQVWEKVGLGGHSVPSEGHPFPGVGWGSPEAAPLLSKLHYPA